MLGTEYNWLISSKRQTGGVPAARLARGGLITLAVAVFCFLCVALRAEPAHRVLLREAAAAAKENRPAEAIALLERAVAAAPDYPRLHLSLARLYAQQQRPDDAFRALDTLAAMGLVIPIAADAAFEPLRADARFPAAAAAFAANAQPQGHADETAWATTDVTGIIESVAIHPRTLESFFGDVHNRCIWYRDVSGPGGVLKKFSADSDGLLGVFALKFSADGQTLWASSSALAEMAGYTSADKGRGFLAAYDLGTRKLTGTYPLPENDQGHVLGDFAIAADGAIYVSDSTAPIIWRLAPGGKQLEKWLENRDFASLQGLAFSADGRSLIVADYASGLWRIDPASRKPARLPAPAGSTLFGIDGLYAAPGGFVAVQGGVNPPRIIRIACDDEGTPGKVEVLLSGHPAMTDPSLGQVINGHFDFIGNSGWALFDDPKAAPAARDVVILRTTLN
ncbi:MAG: tetratricopeptide repeat protein [Opitutae bacterium]|nr:tetratricopeptide repeat protein [Opitutae bacterium]